MDTKIIFCEWLKRIDPDIIYDIGSRDGREAIYFKKIVPNAEVTAFEANPILFKKIAMLPEFINGSIKIMPAAISDKTGTTKFFVPDVNYEAGYDTDWRLGTGSLKEKVSDGSKTQVYVKTKTLDSLLSDSIDKSIALWIDVEGCSYEVLSGMSKIADRVKMIHIEVETERFWEGQMLFDDIVCLLVEKGFYLAIKKIYKHGQGNAIFLNKKVAFNRMIRYKTYIYAYLLSRIRITKRSIMKRLRAFPLSFAQILI
ncbi:FkbM family methyltransferase [bacterium]|nr:FkbM family methyltransferase [bacterium]